jgi:hypothetical protein
MLQIHKIRNISFKHQQQNSQKINDTTTFFFFLSQKATFPFSLLTSQKQEP